MQLTPKQKRLLKLTQSGGTDKDLLLLDEIDELKEKLEEMKERMALPEVIDHNCKMEKVMEMIEEPINVEVELEII